MEEQFINVFNKTHESKKNDNVDNLINDSAKLNEVIINSYDKAIDNFTFQLYLLKFNDHTFIDCDENCNLIKTEIPLSYQVSLSITLTADNIYTINNVTCIKVGSIEQANKEFDSIKGIVDDNSLEYLLETLIFHS